jgi:2-dehydro-3-deoxygluconokinase
MTTDVYTIGEAVGVVASGRIRHENEARLDVTGPEFTVAIGLARLGHAAAWLGRVGDDELGRRVLHTLRGEGVDVADARVDETADTGLLLREFRAGRATRTISYRAGSAGSRLVPGNVRVDRVVAARVLHVTGVTVALDLGARDAVHTAVRAARSAGVTVSVDVRYQERLWPDLREAEEVLTELGCSADVLFVGQDELDLVKPALTGVPEVVVTRGARGASVRVDGVRHDAPSISAPVVDPEGRADGFVAGYLSGRLEQLHPVDRLRRGLLLGAFAAASPSDWQGMPTRGELSPGDLDAGFGAA